ncbi:hypothetical protein EDD76_104178 [Kineothrix alysoides]|uniref:Uncharacterized protein n=1 Tax=Kineothrix alysoides TaxID=1469948 RepID=A0A4R1R261_9FIRM|nr:DUF6056 family protein [Kineothrix alysoides]TCL59441.1 hypothetical protein EDD76_104178 [Kineothrix alysoides]
MDRMRMMMVRIGRWFDDNKIMKGIAAVFGVTIIPMLVAAQYSRASADDFGWYASVRKQVWDETHSIVHFTSTALRTTKDIYNEWQGTFTTTFVQAFQPEIFHPRAYFIVPYIMIFLFCGGTALLIYCILVKILKMNKSVYGIITFLYLLITIQYIPSTGEAFYWFNGAVAYTLAYAIMLLSLYFCLEFIRGGQKRKLFFAIFTAFFIGGGNYLTVVLFPLLLILILFLFVSSRKRALYLLVPLMVFTVTAVINMKAPGTSVRGGEIGFNIHKVFTVIYKSIYSGLKVVRSDFLGNPVILISMIIITLFIVGGMVGKSYEFPFKYPVFFVIMTFGSYLAMFAPTYYAGVGAPFGRMSNLIFFYFTLSLIINIVYLTGWLLRVIREKAGENKEEKYSKGFLNIWNTYKIYLLLFSAVLIGVNTHWYEMTAMTRTVKYLASGEAAQYGREMDVRYEILMDENIKDAQIKPLTVSAGPLFLYDIGEDANEWPNTAAAEFFQKDSVYLKR